MKRLFALVLALGLILAFSMPAAAVDVKFSGTYLFEGWTESNRTLGDDGNLGTGLGNKAPQTSWMNSSLLLNTQFKVAEGLTLNTRARILDKIWGDQGTRDRTVVTTDASTAAATVASRSKYLRENIEWEYLYADFTVGPGFFRAGYAPSMLGTDFLNTDTPVAMLRYFFTGIKGILIYGEYAKNTETEVNLYGSATGGSSVFSGASDSDSTRQQVGIIFTQPTWDGGGYLMNIQDRTAKVAGSAFSAQPYTRDNWLTNWYFRGTFGPLYVDGEFAYSWGDAFKYENSAAGNDISQRSWAADIKARYAFGPAYVGGTWAYVSGDDPATTDKREGGVIWFSGREYKPCLILINPDRDKWLGGIGSGNTSIYPAGVSNGYASGFANFQLYQGFVGFKPIPKLDLFASYSYVKMNEKPTSGGVAFVDDVLGKELDLTATYKIYDNLSYMVGFGYLWAGDAWKGTNAGNQVGNDWLLMHRLTLNF